MALFESIAGSIGSAMVSKFIQGGGSGPQTPDYTDFRFSSGLLEILYLQKKQE